MFSMDRLSSDESRVGWLVMTAAWMAMTVPFIFYFKSIADSLNTIAEEKTGYRKAKRYG